MGEITSDVEAEDSVDLCRVVDSLCPGESLRVNRVLRRSLPASSAVADGGGGFCGLHRPHAEIRCPQEINKRGEIATGQRPFMANQLQRSRA